MKVTILSFPYKRVLSEEKMAIGNIGTGNRLRQGYGGQVISTLATFDMPGCRAMPNPYWNKSSFDRIS